MLYHKYIFDFWLAHCFAQNTIWICRLKNPSILKFQIQIENDMFRYWGILIIAVNFIIIVNVWLSCWNKSFPLVSKLYPKWVINRAPHLCYHFIWNKEKLQRYLINGLIHLTVWRSAVGYVKLPVHLVWLDN